MNDPPPSSHRRWVMSRIRSANTKPELMLRSLLHRMGYRFRINRKDLPGKPDIVLPRYNTVIFVHGCFWHRHPGCKRATTPKSRQEFWERKFSANVERDRLHLTQLADMGWQVLTVWECELEKDPAQTALRIAQELGGPGASPLRYPLPSRKDVLQAAESRLHDHLRKFESP